MANYVIRVVSWQEDGEVSMQLLEQLRYAGIVEIHRDDDNGVCFDIRPPQGISDSRQWASMNAARMESYGYNAVCAPEWPRSYGSYESKVKSLGRGKCDECGMDQELSEGESGRKLCVRCFLLQ